MSPDNPGKFSRREALKRTLLFSTSLLAAGRSALGATAARTDFSGGGIHLLAMGDFGSGNARQQAVAQRMAEFARTLSTPVSAVLALGDNFYGKLTPERFVPHFEEMYSSEHLNCPFYACLGNHDYGPSYDSKQGPAKADMQLEYAKKNPGSRWKMPAKWHAFELPNSNAPLLKIIMLDGNMFEGGLTPQEKVAQSRFLEAELSKESRAQWLWMVSHYPLFSAGIKHDSPRLIREWGPHLKCEPISLYLSGHDHNLQHLRVAGYNPCFVVSGAAGAGLYNIKSDERGYSEKTYGFTHFYLTPENLEVQFINSAGDRLYAFRRSHAGEVATLG